MARWPEKLVRKIRVFVASPGDVAVERARLPGVVQRLNRTLVDSAFIDLVMWEREPLPELSESRELINAELDQADIVVVILWTRLGQPTGGAPSGIFEQVQRSIERWKSTGTPHVLVYACQRAVPRAHVRSQRIHLASQLEQVEAFLKAVRLRGLTHNYDSPDEFERLVYDHLDVVIRELLQAEERPAQQLRDGLVREFDALTLAWRLVVDFKVEPDLLRHLDAKRLREAVEKLESETSTRTDAPWSARLAAAQQQLESKQPNLAPNALWLAWMRNVNAARVEELAKSCRESAEPAAEILEPKLKAASEVVDEVWEGKKLSAAKKSATRRQRPLP